MQACGHVDAQAGDDPRADHPDCIGHGWLQRPIRPQAQQGIDDEVGLLLHSGLGQFASGV
jgi:hypothetical protein